jgi:hypothetical protein
MVEPAGEQISVTDGQAVVVNDSKDDTGDLLTGVLDRKYHWPEGAKVGDGTPGPGRKPFDIDERIVFAMAKVGGTRAEIAAHFGVSETVIGKRFGELIRQAKASRVIRLRQKQYELALEGNVTMLIWLGKQDLKQADESRIRFGSMNQFSDEELEQIAQGKMPGRLGAGNGSDNEGTE